MMSDVPDRAFGKVSSRAAILSGQCGHRK